MHDAHSAKEHASGVESVNGRTETGIAVHPGVAAFLGRERGMLIDGEITPGTGDRYLDVYNPATGEVIARVPQASNADVDRAVNAANRAFEGAWTGLVPAERERLLLRFADVVEAHHEELAQLETLNQGKSIHVARHVDSGASPRFMRYIAGLATKICGQTLDVSIRAAPHQRYTAYTRREPVGVVGAISPWNFPLLIGLWKIMPALAAGCPVVLKPSEVTPLTTLRLAELALEAGLPAGALNVITGDGAVGRSLVEHPLVAKITFTGSGTTGKAIARSAVDRMQRTTLELGGKNPAIFLKDVPVEQAVQGIMLGGFLNSGQVCAASSRLYVAREIYADVVDALGSFVSGMRLGPGMDPETQITPVVSASHREKIMGYIRKAREEGGRIVAGGDVPDRPGYYVNPTIVVDAARTSTIEREEVFGPVVSVTPFDDEDDAVRMANDTEFGLAASLWTNDLGKTLRIVPKIKAGMVWVNTHSLLDPAMPFGGYKQSGIGRDFGIGSVEAFTELKSVCIAHPE